MVREGNSSIDKASGQWLKNRSRFDSQRVFSIGPSSLSVVMGQLNKRLRNRPRKILAETAESQVVSYQQAEYFNVISTF